MKRQDVLAELVGGVWHTTSQDRFLGILRCEAILPEPDIPPEQRWGTAAGSEGYPYVRSIGGVSLFDFREFEPESYSANNGSSSWEYFVPCHQAWDSAVWIEIDHEALGSTFLSGVELLRRWKTQGSSRRIMSLIEGAHIGPLPCRAFKKTFSTRRDPENPHSLAAVLNARRLKPR